MSNIVRRQKLALYLLMFLPGFSWSSWVTRTPLMRDTLHASTEMMGMILFGFSCGSMLGILSAGKAINRFGIRKMTLAGFLVMLAGLLILILAMLSASVPLAFAALLVFGLGLSTVDMAMNIEGAAFEQKIKFSIMTTLHGFFSLGTLAGALAGMMMTALGFSMAFHLNVIVLITVFIICWQFRHMAWASAEKTSENSETRKYKEAILHELRDRRLLLLGVVILAMALAEGSANDWLPLLMIDAHNFSPTSGTAVYLFFTVGMTLGRFMGGYIVDRYGRHRVLQLCAVAASLGLLLIILVQAKAAAVIAVILWGAGASLGFPLTISAAGASGENGEIRVTIAAIIGYIAFLVGPPFLGMIGEHEGLRLAMLPVLVMTCLAIICSRAARET